MTNGPHDHIFKRAFESAEHAAAELRAVLSPALSRHVNWDSLRSEPCTFIDADLNHQQADLLFSAKIADHPAFIYILFEHQSSNDPLMPLRLLAYVVRILEHHQRTAKVILPLPVVIPVVLHHSHTGWRQPLELLPLFGDVVNQVPELESFVPRFQFYLDDISYVSDAQLRLRALQAFPALALWALRDARTPVRLLKSLGYWADLLTELVLAPNGVEAIRSLFEYITLVADDLSAQNLREAVAKAAPLAEPIIMTIAEQLRAEGRAEGLTIAEQLRAEGRAEGLLKGEALLLERLLIGKFGELPTEVQSRLQTASRLDVERWAERVLLADGLEAVFAD